MTWKTIRIREELWLWLAEAAKAEHRSVSNMAETILFDYLKK